MDILNEIRLHSSSWGRPHPNSNVLESHVFGGIFPIIDQPFNTTEIANDVDSTPSYNYPDGNAGQCNIQFDDYVVITGGYVGFSTTVAAYDNVGHRRPLPPLIEGRGFHGCGYYND